MTTAGVFSSVLPLNYKAGIEPAASAVDIEKYPIVLHQAD